VEAAFGRRDEEDQLLALPEVEGHQPRLGAVGLADGRAGEALELMAEAFYRDPIEAHDEWPEQKL
jgi:hypothetical protein